ncbi:MAG: polyphosphate kinase 2, partial [Hyphomicrobiaceae bacterium]|nr:polyphosphate kinase 2 [Hyphomicrobiaceae bacterium]
MVMNETEKTNGVDQPLEQQSPAGSETITNAPASSPAAEANLPPEPIMTPARMRHDPDAIRHAFESGEYPYHSRMSAKVYEAAMEDLQVELLKAQSWVKDSGERIVVLFEGRDAAGKG